MFSAGSCKAQWAHTVEGNGLEKKNRLKNAVLNALDLISVTPFVNTKRYRDFHSFPGLITVHFVQ